MSYDFGMDIPFGASATSPALEQAETRLRQSERSYSKTKNELDTLVSIRSHTPMSQAESVSKDAQIRQLQQRLFNQQHEVNELKRLVEQQRVTIAQQSKAISQPKQPYSTPSRRYGSQHQGSFHGHNTNYPQAPRPLLGSASGETQPHVNPPPPPTFGAQPPTGPRQSSHFSHQPPQWSSSMGYQPQNAPPPPQPQFQQHTSVNPFGSPEPMRTHSSTLGYKPQNKQSSHGSNSNPPSGQKHPNMPRSNQSSQPSNDSMALVKVADVQNADPVKISFERVVNMAQQYTFAHANTPSTAKDNLMPGAIKERLLKAASQTTAFQFMSSPYTRYLLVTKVIIQWIMKAILRHDCFKGLDPEADSAIEALKGSIYQSTPAQVKFQILNNIGQQMKRLKQRPDFDQYCQHLARQRGNEIWAIIKPMMHTKTSRDWDDLMSLIVEAHHLAVLLFSGAEEYRYEIPATGSLFTTATMVARDPFQNVKSPEQLELEHAQVRLGITPHVTVRRNSPGGLVTSATVVPASVLLRVGN